MSLHNELEKVFPIIESLFDKKDLSTFASCDRRNLNCYHFSLGLWIRNTLLNENSNLYFLFKESGIVSKDFISGYIISEFYDYLHKKI